MSLDKAENDIKNLQNEKLDRVLLEDVSVETLKGIDISSETAAVTEAIKVLIQIVTKLKST